MCIHDDVNGEKAVSLTDKINDAVNYYGSRYCSL